MVSMLLDNSHDEIRVRAISNYPMLFGEQKNFDDHFIGVIRNESQDR